MFEFFSFWLICVSQLWLSQCMLTKLTCCTLVIKWILLHYLFNLALTYCCAFRPINTSSRSFLANFELVQVQKVLLNNLTGCCIQNVVRYLSICMSVAYILSISATPTIPLQHELIIKM